MVAKSAVLAAIADPSRTVSRAIALRGKVLEPPAHPVTAVSGASRGGG